MSGKGKGGKDAAAPADPLREDPSVVADDAEFPEPSLYFKVFESEADEPEAKIRADVNALYDHWIEKYGRRWPEDGLNTEDMVWVAEESTAKRRARRRTHQRRGRPVEETEYENEFIPFSDDPAAPAADGAAASTSAAGAAKPGAGAGGAGKGGKRGGASGASATAAGAGAAAAPPRRPRTNYEKTAAGGKWVTDEFESADYEAGNLEHLWDMYLWDAEGKPTMMPDTPAAQQEGEESEDWDDFYTAYRPRGIDTEDAREAVWATDEFESDEDNTESEWAPEYVGAGLGLLAEDPLNPQFSLRHSNHPLAPFPGEPLKWASYVYPDFTTYEGLSKQSIPHGMGVMTFGTGTGGGFAMSAVKHGDRYEGEFQAGYAHGLGQFTSETTGEVYIGEFFAGQRHGCGLVLDMKPYFYLLERGADPVDAYRRTAGAMLRNLELRTWYRGAKLGDAGEDEVVTVSVLKDGMDNPFDVALRNTLHDAKLRRWQGMGPADKAKDRVLAIVERTRARHPGPAAGYYGLDAKGRVVRNVVGSDGQDTEFDSMDMLQGVDTDGDLGLGWEGATDSSEAPLEPRIYEAAVAEAADDRIEDESFKDSVLGNALINPFTGLDLKTYLDGKESHHIDLYNTYLRSKEGRALLGQGDEAADAAAAPRSAGGEGDASRLQRLYDAAGVSEADVEAAEELYKRWQRLLGEDDASVLAPARRPGNPLAPDDSDTAFETESDMMELCDLGEMLGTVQEAREIVERARMWRFKPYGEVTIRMAQDANGSPVTLMQDPLHYPHGTKFMAPGPLGLCHPLPDDPALRTEMAKVARNFAAIHDRYNFDWDPQPGSVQYQIDQRIRRAQELRANALARYLEAADEALAEAPEGEGDQRLLLADASAALADGAATPAAASGSGAGAPVRFGGGGGGGSVFACMSASGPLLGRVRLGAASRVVLDALAAAVAAGPRSGRPRLARPARGRA